MKNSQSAGGSTNSVPVAASRKEQEDANVERRPSWRLRVDEQDRSKFSLEDTRQGGSSTGTGSATASNNPPAPSSAPTSTSRTAGGYHSEIPYGLAQRNPSLRSKLGKGIIEQTGLGGPHTGTSSSSSASSTPPHGKPPLPPGEQDATSGSPHQLPQDDERDMRNSGGAQGAILRKKKTKRRSTGVVQFNADVSPMLPFFTHYSPNFPLVLQQMSATQNPNPLCSGSSVPLLPFQLGPDASSLMMHAEASSRSMKLTRLLKHLSCRS